MLTINTNSIQYQKSLNMIVSFWGLIGLVAGQMLSIIDVFAGDWSTVFLTPTAGMTISLLFSMRFSKSVTEYEMDRRGIQKLKKKRYLLNFN